MSHDHGLPPEARRQSAQLDNVGSAIAPWLGILAAVVLLLLGATIVTRASSTPRAAEESAMEFPR